MSVLGRSKVIGFQYLAGAVLLGIIQRVAGFSFESLKIALVVLLVITVYRLFRVRCPHCGKSPFWGPGSSKLFPPECRNCGASTHASVPAA
jgi:hypothetical protein